MEHTDLGGSFVKPQSGKDCELVLEHCPQRGGVVLTVGIKPRPVSLLCVCLVAYKLCVPDSCVCAAAQGRGR